MYSDFWLPKKSWLDILSIGCVNEMCYIARQRYPLYFSLKTNKQQLTAHLLFYSLLL